MKVSVEAGSFLGIPGASLAAAGLACGLPVVLAVCTFALMISVMVVTKPAIELAKRWSSGELFMLPIFIQRHPETTFNRSPCSVGR
jgi:hypothetical protein